MSKISVNELNENLKELIINGALSDTDYNALTARVDSNMQRLQALSTAAVAAQYTLEKPEE